MAEVAYIFPLPLCACECGGRVRKPENEYILGHNNSRDMKYKLVARSMVPEILLAEYARKIEEIRRWQVR